MEVRGKRVLVVGLGRSGQEAARFLADRGAIVNVTDARPPSAFQAQLPLLMERRIGLELGGHDQANFLAQELIVVSPGVAWDLDHLEAARRRKIPVVTEVELASWFVEGRLIGITGSNGKTTTTALLGRMLQASGFPTFVGGNIGVPLISAVGRTHPDTFLVTELSSFQLEAIQGLHPNVAVLLNLSPNHLDRHASFEAYVRAKAQIFRNQTSEDYAILNADDPAVMKLAPEIRSRKLFFSRRRDLAHGLFVAGGEIRFRVRNLERALLKADEVPLQGSFNLENVLAAAAAACLVGADFDAIRRAVREFEGVEHRLEFVREIRGVKFYNDSKATSVGATAKALSVFEGGVHLILGGKDKGAPYLPLRPLLKSRVREVLLIGAAAGRMEKELQGAAELVHAGDLTTAVERAWERAQPGDVVLLAPACSSFDQFQDFEHRGRVFKEEVNRLSAPAASAAGPEPLAKAPTTSGDPPTSPASTERWPETAKTPRRAETDGSLEGSRIPAEVAAPEDEARKQFKRELVYVYEMGAEEFAPMDFEPPPAEGESSPLSTEELRPLEIVKDEPLMFELAAGPRASGGSPEKETTAREQELSTDRRGAGGAGTT